MMALNWCAGNILGNKMIISHKFKFIFIKTYKTAGTSLEAYFSPFAGPTDVLTPIHPPVVGHQPQNHSGFFNHISASELQKKIDPAVWSTYFKFCIERNPWEKVISFYWMKKSELPDLTIDEFLKFDNIGYNFDLYSNGESILVDRVLRYENIDNELANIFSKLGISFDGKLPGLAKTEFRKDRRQFAEILTSEQIQKIAFKFQKEIKFYSILN